MLNIFHLQLSSRLASDHSIHFPKDPVHSFERNPLSLRQDEDNRYLQDSQYVLF